MGKTFQKKNDGFVCEVCGAENPPAEKTCRNHCRVCLHSKHVDIFPGDRAETCHGIFVPVEVELSSAVPSSLIFVCKKCGKKGRNKIASDDSREAVFGIMEKNS